MIGQQNLGLLIQSVRNNLAKEKRGFRLYSFYLIVILCNFVLFSSALPMMFTEKELCGSSGANTS